MSEILTSQMHDYFEYLDEAQGAVDLVTIRELRIGDGPVRPVQLSTPLPRRTSRGWVVAGATSAALLLLVGGGVLLSTSTRSDAPVADTVVPATLAESAPATETQWPGLTADIPDGVESGTLTTSLGTARWVHLTGDEYTLPSPGPLEVNANGEFIVSDLPTGFWYSDGGVEWRRERQLRPIPGDPADVDQMTRYIPEGAPGGGLVVPWVPYADGSYARYWTISYDPIEIWSSEGASWVEEDLSGFVPPESDGFDWETDISRPITRYVSPEGVPGTQSILHVRFSGAPLDEPQCQEAVERLLVLDWSDGGRRVTSTEVPWVVHCAEPHLVTLFGTADSVYAYVGDWSTGQVSVWRTSDGYTWTGLGSLHDQLGSLSSSDLKVTVLPALQEPDTEEPIRNQIAVVRAIGESHDYWWESTDGVNWTSAPEGLPEGSHLTRLESGWFGTDGEEWWMHVGESWESLAELGVDRNGDHCGEALRSSGRTTLIFTFSCDRDTSGDPPTDLWVISHDS